MNNRGKLFKRAQASFREKRFAEVERLIRSVLEHRPEISILDVGGRGEYWHGLPADLRPKTRIVCLNFADELELYKSSDDDLRIENEVGDACDMPQYPDDSFDIVHSNSVIEHVGSLGKMVDFARETSRVGNAYYHQTPNFWFPVEPHYGVPFFHWLPDQFKLWLFTKMSIGYAPRCDLRTAIPRIDHTRMIGKFMMRDLFRDAVMKRERFGPLTKSIIMMRDYKV